MPLIIKKIEFKKPEVVYLELNKTANSKHYKGIVTKQGNETSDLPPHADYVRAFDRMTPHALIILGFADHNYPLIDKEMIMDMQYFNKFEWEDDARFQGITLKAVAFKGNSSTPESISFHFLKESPYGGEQLLKTPYLALERKPAPAEADNDYESDGSEKKEAHISKQYPLLDILISQIETLITEATEHQQEMKFAKNPQTTLFVDDKGDLVPAE